MQLFQCFHCCLNGPLLCHDPSVEQSALKPQWLLWLWHYDKMAEWLAALLQSFLNLLQLWHYDNTMVECLNLLFQGLLWLGYSCTPLGKSSPTFSCTCQTFKSIFLDCYKNSAFRNMNCIKQFVKFFNFGVNPLRFSWHQGWAWIQKCDVHLAN